MKALIDFIETHINFTAVLGLVALIVFYHTNQYQERQLADARHAEALAEAEQARIDADARIEQALRDMDARHAEAMAKVERERGEARKLQVKLEQERNKALIEILKARADLGDLHFRNAKEFHLQLQKFYPGLDIMQEIYGDNIPEDLADIAEEARQFSRKPE